MAFNVIDAQDKRTDELLKEVAELQAFEAIPDRLSDAISSEQEGELDLEDMDLVRAAGYRKTPNFEEFMKKIK